MSCVDHEGTSFKVTESICRVLITEEEVLKLRTLYVLCKSLIKKFSS